MLSTHTRCTVVTILCVLCCYAWACTYPVSGVPAETHGINPFQLTVTPVNSTTAATVFQSRRLYNVTVSGSRPFAGLYLKAFLGSDPARPSVFAGTFVTIPHDYTQNRACASSATVIHSNQRRANPRTTDSFIWKSPALKVGAVTFQAAIVEQFHANGSVAVWYGGPEAPCTVTLAQYVVLDDVTTVLPIHSIRWPFLSLRWNTDLLKNPGATHTTCFSVLVLLLLVSLMLV